MLRFLTSTALTAAILVLGGCPESPLEARTCGAFFCAADTECDRIQSPPRCIPIDQRQACQGQLLGAPCGERFTGRTTDGDHHCGSDGLCVSGGFCGNGAIEDGEDCEGTPPPGTTCADDGQYEGVVACTECRLDYTECGGRCGDGEVNGTEVCDGPVDCGAQGFHPKVVGCTEDCSAQLEVCPRCGDGSLDAQYETCDGEAVGELTCASYGYYGGDVTCGADCQPVEAVEQDDCEGFCGDGVRNGQEVCDVGDTGPLTCEGYGFYRGMLGCMATAQAEPGEPNNCSEVDPLPCNGFCGDGVLDKAEGEQCDGLADDGIDCVDLGFDGGTVLCNEFCVRDVALCFFHGFVEVESISGTNLKRPWANAEDDIYVPGGVGAVLHYNGQSWDKDFPTNVKLLAAAGVPNPDGPATDVWFGGEQARIVHKSGDDWTSSTITFGDDPPIDKAVEDMVMVPDGSGGHVLFVGGRNGLLAKLEDGSWQDLYPAAGPIDPDARTMGIWGTAPDNVFAAVTSGHVYHWDGTTWSLFVHLQEVIDSQGLALGDALWSLTGLPSGHLYLGMKDAFAVYEPAGAGEWSVYPTNIDSELQFKEVLALSPTEVYLAGEDGVVVFFNGKYGRQLPTPTEENLGGISGFSRDTLVAFGNGGRILSWDATSFSKMTGKDSALGGTVRNVFGWADDSAIAVGFGQANVGLWDGVDWVPVAFDTTYPGLVPSYFAVWGESVDDFIAVGGNGANEGAAFRYQDGVQTVIGDLTDTGLPHQAIWGRSIDEVYVGGGTAGLWHYDGISATKDTGLTGQWQVNGIWGATSGELFVVGTNGRIRRKDSEGWQNIGILSPPATDLSTTKLNAVWGSSASNVFIAGDGGRLFRYHGEGDAYPLPYATFFNLKGISGTASNDVMVVGGAGAIVHFDGTRLSRIVSGDQEASFTSTWAHPGGPYLAVGNSGRLFSDPDPLPRIHGGTCGAATPLYCQSEVVGDTHLAAQEAPDSCGVAAQGNAMVYRVQVPIDGEATFTLTPLEGAPHLRVLSASEGGCDASQCLGEDSTAVTITTQVGDALFVVVSGADASFRLDVSCTKTL